MVGRSKGVIRVLVVAVAAALVMRCMDGACKDFFTWLPSPAAMQAKSLDTTGQSEPTLVTSSQAPQSAAQPGRSLNSHEQAACKLSGKVRIRI